MSVCACACVCVCVFVCTCDYMFVRVSVCACVCERVVRTCVCELYKHNVHCDRLTNLRSALQAAVDGGRCDAIKSSVTRHRV